MPLSYYVYIGTVVTLIHNFLHYCTQLWLNLSSPTPLTAGRVPNCRRCPQCFFDFNATLYQLLSSVEAEMMRVGQFSGVYSNLTIETVEVALTSLHTELNGIAVTLAGLQVTPSQLDMLNITLMQVCWSPTWAHDMRLLRINILSCMCYFRAYVSFMQCCTINT